MNLISLIIIVLFSILIGAMLAIAALWYIFNRFSTSAPPVKHEVTSPLHLPRVEQFRMPQILLNILQTTDVPKKETCVALNLIFQFLFQELRNTDEVRSWFLKKLSLEFEELVNRSTTGKLLDKVTIRELELGTQFPIIHGVSVLDSQMDSSQKYIESLDVCLDLEYQGGFQLGTTVRMLLGTTAIVSVKVSHLSGRGRLQFSRQPYSHWSFTFYSEPSLELQVESQFQGRPVPHVTSLIVSQIRKAVKKKHTLPQFKLRYKPFFLPSSLFIPNPQDEGLGDLDPVLPGVLRVSLVECTRLNPDLLSGNVFCTLAIDSAPWVYLVQRDTHDIMTMDLTVKRRPSQNLGVTFRPDPGTSLVYVDSVDGFSPAGKARLRKGDLLLAVQGCKVSSLNHASKLLRSAGNQFTLRVERKRLNFQSDELRKLQKEAEAVSEKGVQHSTTQAPTPGSPKGLRHRRKSEDHSETESSSSTTATPSSSPVKKLESNKIPSSLAPEDKSNATSRKLSSCAISPNTLQMFRTKEVLTSSVLQFEETFTFEVGESASFFNLGVWSSSTSADTKDTLLGHISLPISYIVEKCNITGLGHFIKRWQLQEPCVSSKPHKLTAHSGFDPTLCYGDILLCFITESVKSPSSNHTPKLTSSSRGETENLLDHPTALSLSMKESPAKDYNAHSNLSPNNEESSTHDFVRTHFSRSTLCDFCSKKIWLKDAVQCRSCRMTCHKKCVAKCQANAICVPCDELILEDSLTIPQVPSPTNAPEIITTFDDTEALPIIEPPSTPAPQGHKRGLGSLLASVASAAQARGIKRAGSASNLSPPNSETPCHSPTNTINTTTVSFNAGSLSFSRSLPHSPQLSPSASRKTSLAEVALFQLPDELVELDDPQSEQRLEEALEQLLHHSEDNHEDIMTVAKDTGKNLYCGLPERKDKINKLISKLKVAMDREMQLQEALEAEAEDISDKARRAFLLGKSEQRVQAITVLMLHCCSGLQHIQDTEEEEALGIECLPIEDPMLKKAAECLE